MNRRTLSAFTLIELLVVIAIIAILAAILFPVFARAREKGRQASCQSNCKNVALGILMYSQDYDERMPMGSRTTAIGGLRWSEQIQAYIKNTQVFNCPSNPRNVYIATGPSGGFGYNACFLNDVPAARIIKPPETVLLGDSCGVQNTNPFRVRPDAAVAWCNAADNWNVRPVGLAVPCLATANAGTCNNNNPQCSRLAYRHSEQANIAFADGHVKTMKYGDLNRTATNAVCNSGNANAAACGTESNQALDSRSQFLLWNLF